LTVRKCDPERHRAAAISAPGTGPALGDRVRRALGGDRPGRGLLPRWARTSPF
jgi:hypothetical protein